MKICKEAKVEFVRANLAIYLNYRKEFARYARDKFNYSPKTVDEDILLSFDKAWKEYSNDKDQETTQ